MFVSLFGAEIVMCILCGSIEVPELNLVLIVVILGVAYALLASVYTITAELY